VKKEQVIGLALVKVFVGLVEEEVQEKDAAASVISMPSAAPSALPSSSPSLSLAGEVGASREEAGGGGEQTTTTTTTSEYYIAIEISLYGNHSDSRAENVREKDGKF
jgi:hypothetical protein